MPRHPLGKRTIYNGNTADDRFQSVQPSLGNTTIGRNTDLDDQQNISVQSPREMIRSKRRESHIRMNNITNNQTDVLFKTRTLFPFDLFPDRLVISSTKIEITFFLFFYSYHTTNIPLQDIGYVDMTTALFLSTLKIINIRNENPIVLSNLWHKDAKRAKRIIDGLLLAQEAGVDVTVIDPKSLLDKIESIGG